MRAEDGDYSPGADRIVFSEWEGPASKPADKGVRWLWKLFTGLFIPQERQRFLPTASGYTLIILAVGLCAAAYNTGSNILFLVLALLLSLFILSGVLSWMNFRRLRWRVEGELPFRCGERGTVRVRVDNQKRYLPAEEIFFTLQEKDHKLKEFVSLRVPVPAGETLRERWVVVPENRGRMEVILSGAQSKFPFGFMRKTIGRPQTVEFSVWPKRIPCRVQQHPWSQKHLHGDASRHPGQGDDLIQIRRYEYGDPFHLVHWKATARTGHIMIRKMAGDEKEGLYFYLDTTKLVWRTSENFENFCRLAGSLAEKLFAAGQFRGYFGPSLSLQLVKKEEEVWHFLDLLSGLARETPRATGERPIIRKNTLQFEPYGETGAQAILAGQVFATS
ncbi:MAG: DUF58 domain-containing protein [Opitutales bacterium]|nr:DUF58 domain-containing protein [Opitutales bacterium]MCH8541292.1 DUF58 domain-containing protein [Opitutales bacterium]